jgi:phospholipid/cholesterol/gamma-HCH transport system substrate-binding protein
MTRIRGLDARTAGDAVKLLVFIVVTTLATGVLAVTIGNISFGRHTDYKAVFSDVTGLSKGDDVRIAGVRVGSVEDIAIHDRDQAIVTFSVDADSRLTQGTNATIRYRNLIGQRYIALTQEAGGAAALTEGDTIPIERTHPALDLTVLFNGFKPLFAALSPDDINKLSYEIIRVFQGEGGTVDSLLSSTASVTTELANRDKVIGDLITNLNDVLETLGSRDEQLSDLIVRLQQFVSGLKSDRDAILGSLDDVSGLATETASLLRDARPELATDINRLRQVAATLDRHRDEIDNSLQILPIKLAKIGRTASYGSWFNFYLCNFKGRIKVPGAGGQELVIPIDFNTDAARCDLG